MNLSMPVGPYLCLLRYAEVTQESGLFFMLQAKAKKPLEESCFVLRVKLRSDLHMQQTIEFWGGKEYCTSSDDGGGHILSTPSFQNNLQIKK